MDERPSSRSNTPKMTMSSTDIRNRYFKHFFHISCHHQFDKHLMMSIPLLRKIKADPRHRYRIDRRQLDRRFIATRPCDI